MKTLPGRKGYCYHLAVNALEGFLVHISQPRKYPPCFPIQLPPKPKKPLQLPPMNLHSQEQCKMFSASLCSLRGQGKSIDTVSIHEIMLVFFQKERDKAISNDSLWWEICFFACLGISCCFGICVSAERNKEIERF